jgi:hypothetical protein
VKVDALGDTLDVTTVYNIRVRDYHTYFVGCPEWGFSVWAHNADCAVLIRDGEKFILKSRVDGRVLAQGAEKDVLAFAKEQGHELVTPSGRLSSLPNKGPTLADFKPGDSGFSGVYDTETGLWHAQPSGTAQVPPRLANGDAAPEFVAQAGGHQTVEAQLKAGAEVTGDKTVGFAAVQNADGSLTVRWNSGINQRNFQQRAVPEQFRQKIITEIQNATGRVVKSE